MCENIMGLVLIQMKKTRKIKMVKPRKITILKIRLRYVLSWSNVGLVPTFHEVSTFIG